MEGADKEDYGADYLHMVSIDYSVSGYYSISDSTLLMRLSLIQKPFNLSSLIRDLVVL